MIRLRTLLTTVKNSPLIFNVYKPKDITSYDVLRAFKRGLPRPFSKIGHFGTLDPFATGVLMIGVNGATRLNEHIHRELPKTYLAHGILGQQTPTGDTTVDLVQVDDSSYLKEVISKFDKDFIQSQLQERFVGEYWQAPPAYSAAKFEGKALHEWAREGVTIKKEKKQREILHLEVVTYSFPKLTIKVTASSGTYIRTLFEDCAQHLGTLGVLEDLERVSVGHINSQEAITQPEWPQREDLSIWDKALSVDQVLRYERVEASEGKYKRFINGNPITPYDLPSGEYAWVYFDDQLLGLSQKKEDQLWPVINFAK